MTEGPSVRYARRRIKRVRNRKITSASGNKPKGIPEPFEFVGQTITEVKAHGKHLYVTLTHVGTLRFHFGLHGTVLVGNGVQGKNKPTLRFDLEGGESVLFLSASIALVTSIPEFPNTDPLKKAFDKVLAAKALGEGVCVSDVLLSQTHFAGVGNIPKNEILFAAKVNPTSTVLPEGVAMEVVEGAVKFLTGWYNKKCQAEDIKAMVPLHIYKKWKCPDCKINLKKGYVGKTSRWTKWCESCSVCYGVPTAEVRYGKAEAKEMKTDKMASDTATKKRKQTTKIRTTKKQKK
eukprot:TRINITY_DN1622_c0_g1_i1.p1 TRINITY_DN1622_c0_g1~~TRINITY_DN1622_c0_g1_i1.p1  ORF type:complete len:291 (+),score=39.99 TRINITY_DN1622_c0_g1_i1:32-904(+)